MSEYKAGMLRAADWFDEAADDLADWGMYVSGYFQEKHGLSADIKKYRDRAAILRAEAEQQQPVPVPKETALQQYSRFMAQGDERSPIERLRFFLSLALTGQDWLDVEQFIDDIDAAPKTAPTPERVMVPVEPTEKMIKAAIVSWIGEPFTGNLTSEELESDEKNRARDAWSAMLRAAQEAKE